MTKEKRVALTPRGPGHQFAFYGDSCSGVPGALHEENLAKVNSVVQRLDPAPEFIIFPGDEVIGLIPDEVELRAQWRHFFDVEMAWLKKTAIPMYHSTGNHTTYNTMSARVFADVMSHLPRNGPADQPGLSYFIRDGDMLLVFVHTLWSGLGGEGHVELDWLGTTLADNADARWKFVVGHHPAFPVNGYVGPYQRTLGDEYVAQFWHLLTEAGVMAYLCSHILAFDVQCHDGVLQITSAGAVTAHRMPDGVEYLHCVQMAVDTDGLRYQVFDEEGEIRETLEWPPPVSDSLKLLRRGYNPCHLAHQPGSTLVTRLRISGTVAGTQPRQTILAALENNGACPVWVGLVGRQKQLTVVMQPQRGRSPHQWLGPCLADQHHMDLDILLNGQMGPGGVLWRSAGATTWTGFQAMSAWGTDRLVWPEHLHVGQHGEPDSDSQFAGDLAVWLGSHSHQI